MKSEQQSVAGAMWVERCKKAGVFIRRQVNDVEGIALLNVRIRNINYGDQFAMDDPYGSDFGGDDYIASFLRGRWPKVEKPTPLTFVYQGYRYVEAVDPKDGQRYRYTGGMRDVERVTSHMSGDAAGQRFLHREFVLDRVPASGLRPRYGVSFEDISTPEERQHWIAGSSLKVIDLETKEVIAERIGYMVDRGQGNRSGGRSPWLRAASYSCPRFRGDGASDQTGQTARFVEQVLQPIKGE
ncbi:hypothetical protein [Ramlibacter sp. AN1133]|uniref:hypothetical protein n=1 Tax=Ramlibacter sp. AN1133 TaxID=3133429 RepID=UPI0030BE77B6